MARTKKQQLPIKTFSKGIVTEVNPLSFPPDASIDEVNMELLPDGTRRRRKGFATIGSPSPSFTTLAGLGEVNNPVTVHLWEAVNNEGETDLLVIRLDDYIGFYRNNRSEVLESEVDRITTLNLDPEVSVQFANVYGKLVMTTGSDEVVVFSYDSDTEIVSYETVRITTRDLWGIETGLDIDERRFSIPISDHDYLYNMFNNGWPWEAYYRFVTGGGSFITGVQTPVWTRPYGTETIWPAESDVYHDYTEFDGIRQVYSSFRLAGSEPTTSTPLSGKAILDVFNRGASRVDFYTYMRKTAPTGLPQDYTEGVISVVASYAGRVWYAIKPTNTVDTDNRSPNLGTMIFYSQVSDTVEGMGKCYAKNDPTGADRNDPLDTDGGFITIPNIGEVKRMEVVADSLIIIASNGIWEVYGGDAGFSATSQTVSKAATVFGVYDRSLVKGGNFLSVWSTDGILVISKQPGDFQANVQNITEKSIQTLYNAIPATTKTGVVGSYIPSLRQVRWMYYEDPEGFDPTPATQTFRYNRELVYHLDFGAFTPNSFAYVNGLLPVGYRPLSLISTEAQVETVTDNLGFTVTDNLSDPVEISVESVVQSELEPVQYLVISPGDETATLQLVASTRREFADYNNLWPIPAYMVTGYAVGEDASKDLRSPFVITHFKRTEDGFVEDGGDPDNLNFSNPSGCLLQGRWEWTDSAAAGKWTTKNQAYRLPRYYGPVDGSDTFDFGYTVVTTRNKVRGSGRALSLLFEAEDFLNEFGHQTEDSRDMHVHGWTIEMVAETD